jgi:hypothetical protein
MDHRDSIHFQHIIVGVKSLRITIWYFYIHLLILTCNKMKEAEFMENRKGSDRRDMSGRREESDRRLDSIPVALNRRSGIDRRASEDRRLSIDRRLIGAFISGM